MIFDFIFLQVYRLIHFFVFLLLQILYPILSPKIKSIIRQKNNSLFSQTSQTPQKTKSTPSIWIHAASGEFEYAKSIIRELKSKDSSIQIVVTYFSTSYQKSIQNFSGVDYCEILPWDLSWPLQKFIQKYQPQAVIIARTDVWPEMIHQIQKAKIPSLLFSATLGPASARHRWPFSRFIRWNLDQLTQIFVVAEKDLELFKKTKTQTPIQIQGDTRYDQVIYRLGQNTNLKQNLLHGSHKKATLLLGSTWPEDEKALLPALPQLLQDLQIILAPHEASLEHLSALESELQKLKIKSVRYSQIQDWDKNKILIIDQFGILASLYLWSDLSFVGGSFKKQVHSVMEPLAAGNICWVGPYYENNREAVEFQKTNHVRVMTSSDQLIKDVHAIDFTQLKQNKDSLQQLVRAKQGATQHVTDWLSQNMKK